jgi:hypothetical protein
MDSTRPIHRLTALWAFAECGLGGFMHALHLPFSGILVGGISVTVITIISWLSPKETRFKRVLQALIVVLLVKGIVSPHSPPTAYVAVAFQGVFGGLVYRFLRVSTASIAFTFVIAAMESTFQKFLVLTLFFGTALWEAIDSYGNAVVRKMSWLDGITASEVLIGIYVGIYLIGAIWFAWQNTLLWREWKGGRMVWFEPKADAPGNPVKRKKPKVPKWAIATVLAVAIYFIEPTESAWQRAVYVFARAIIAIGLWFYVVVPAFSWLVRKLTRRYRSRWSDKIDSTMALFPEIKSIVYGAWDATKGSPLHLRLGRFLRYLLAGMVMG